MIRWLGQEAQPAPEDAAAKAAYKEAQESSWPPSEGDIEAIGAAAGLAAGTVLCVEAGPLAVACGAIGGVIGGVVGNVLFNVVDNLLASAQEGEFARGLRGLEAIVYARDVTTQAFISKVFEECVKPRSYYEAGKLLRKWGAPLAENDLIPESLLRDWSSDPESVYPKIKKWEKDMFSATAAAIAQCKTKEEIQRRQAASAGGGVAPLLVGAAILGAAWLLFAA